MLTRGYCIGFIIDELSEIVSKLLGVQNLILMTYQFILKIFF